MGHLEKARSRLRIVTTANLFARLCMCSINGPLVLRDRMVFFTGTHEKDCRKEVLQVKSSTNCVFHYVFCKPRRRIPPTDIQNTGTNIAVQERARKLSRTSLSRDILTTIPFPLSKIHRESITRRTHFRFLPRQSLRGTHQGYSIHITNTMSEESRRTMTQSRRRPRNNEILCGKSRTTNSILRSTTTMRAKEFFFALVLLASCWTIQVTDAISLLDGQYVTTTDVTDYLNLALDVSKMSESENIDVKLDIYKNVSLFPSTQIYRPRIVWSEFALPLICFCRSHVFIFHFQFISVHMKGCPTSKAQHSDTAKLVSHRRRRYEKQSILSHVSIRFLGLGIQPGRRG